MSLTEADVSTDDAFVAFDGADVNTGETNAPILTTVLEKSTECPKEMTNELKEEVWEVIEWVVILGFWNLAPKDEVPEVKEEV